MASKEREATITRKAPLRGFRWIMFVGAEGAFADEPRAKATVLKVICKDDGNLSATDVRTKTDEYGAEMVLRFSSTYEEVEIKTDGEPSIEIARRSQTRRDQDIGAVERLNGTVLASSIACV